MPDTRQLDVRGLSCPEPVLRTTEVLRQLVAGTLEVLVDSETARDNVTRSAERAGWGITAQDGPDGSRRLILRK